MSVEAKDKITVIINGSMHRIALPEISYGQVAMLAGYPRTTAQGDEMVFSIIYERGPEGDRHGILMPGRAVGVEPNMRFSVAITGVA